MGEADPDMHPAFESSSNMAAASYTINAEYNRACPPNQEQNAKPKDSTNDSKTSEDKLPG